MCSTTLDITEECVQHCKTPSTIMNTINSIHSMKRQCRVCDEPAAGFHFGAFTCEGCKSFFGRTYNNVSSLGDCKSGGCCIINKKNRTACKACRLRKCLLVGMSKSGSRYGRRSNWFKVTCLMEDQKPSTEEFSSDKCWSTSDSIDDNDTIDVCSVTEDARNSPCHRRLSPALSSPDSHSSDNSVETDTSRSSSSIYSHFDASSYHSFSFNGSHSLPQLFLPPNAVSLSQPTFPNPYMYPYLYHALPKLPLALPGIVKDIKTEESKYKLDNKPESKDTVTGRLAGIKRVGEKDIDDMYIAKKRCVPMITVKSEDELIQSSSQNSRNIKLESLVSKSIKLNSETPNLNDNSQEESPIDLSIKSKGQQQEFIKHSLTNKKDPCILDLSVKSSKLTEEKISSKENSNSSLPTYDSKHDNNSEDTLIVSTPSVDNINMPSPTLPSTSSHNIPVVPLNLSARVH